MIVVLAADSQIAAYLFSHALICESAAKKGCFGLMPALRKLNILYSLHAVKLRRNFQPNLLFGLAAYL
jgi:hypothetical protein